MADIAGDRSLSAPAPESYFSSTSDQFWPQHHPPSGGPEVSAVSESQRHEAGGGTTAVGEEGPTARCTSERQFETDPGI